MTLENSGNEIPSTGTSSTSARDIRVKHLQKQRNHERPVARAEACERFVRIENWMEVDDNGDAIADPDTGEIRKRTKSVVYLCRGRDCPCPRCQSATARRSAKETVAKIQLGWKRAVKNGLAVFAVSISPPYNKSSLRRALIDVRSFRKRLMKSVKFKRLLGGGIWRIEIKFPDHPHLHLVVEADPHVEKWLPMLRALVSDKAHTRVDDEILKKTVVADELMTVKDAEDWGGYFLKNHYANGFSTLSADEIEAAFPVLDKFKVRKNTFGTWRGLTPPKLPTCDDRGNKRTRLGRKKGNPNITPEDIVHEDLGYRSKEWMENEEDGTKWVLMDAIIVPNEDQSDDGVRRKNPKSKLRRADLEQRRSPRA